MLPRNVQPTETAEYPGTPHDLEITLSTQIDRQSDKLVKPQGKQVRWTIGNLHTVSWPARWQCSSGSFLLLVQCFAISLYIHAFCCYMCSSLEYFVLPVNGMYCCHSCGDHAAGKVQNIGPVSKIALGIYCWSCSAVTVLLSWMARLTLWPLNWWMTYIWDVQAMLQYYWTVCRPCISTSLSQTSFWWLMVFHFMHTGWC